MLAEKQRLSVFDVVGPGCGGQIEVLIAWNERILQSRHYPVGPKVSIGSKANINLPFGTTVRNFNLLESRDGQAFVNLPFETKNFLQRENTQTQLKDNAYKLQQNEVVFISFGNNIHLAIRFAPLTEKIALSSPLLFSSSEYTTLLSALILTTLSGLIFSVLSPKIEKREEIVERIVQVRFEPPPLRLENSPVPVPVPLIVPVPETVTKSMTAGPRSNPHSGLHSGQVKTGPRVGAQTKSVEADPTKIGLLSVLSTDGVRKKMDLAYNGTGELIGVGEKATGYSGFNHNNSGDDLGAKLKNTGASGAGTATVGIADVKMSQTHRGYDPASKGQEFGVKVNVGVVIGGNEENFIGRIDKAAVRKAVQSHLPAIKNCYDREYKVNTNLAGKIVIAWEIHQRGVGKNARVVESESTMDNKVVEACVSSVIETIGFPEPPEGAVVEVTGFPFVFSGAQ